MRNLLSSLGPTLDLMGWVALIAAAGFYAFAVAESRKDAGWKCASYEIRVFEGQECLVFHTSEGTIRSELLVLEHHPTSPGQELVYYREDKTGSWQLEKPSSQVRFLYWTAGALAAAFVVSRLLRLVANMS